MFLLSELNYKLFGANCISFEIKIFVKRSVTSIIFLLHFHNKST